MVNLIFCVFLGSVLVLLEFLISDLKIKLETIIIEFVKDILIDIVENVIVVCD